MPSPLPTFFHGEVLDQQTLYEIGVSYHLTFTNNQHGLIGQTFICGKSGLLTKINLRGKVALLSSAIFNLDIYAVDESGLPTGTSLANTTFDQQLFSGVYSNQDIIFINDPEEEIYPATLVAGVKYAFVVSWLSGNSHALSFEMGDGDTIQDKYSRGEACIKPSGESWSFADPGYFCDLVFKTYITV